MVELKECESAAGNVIGSCFPQQRWHFFTHYIIFWDLNTSEYKKVHQKLSVCKVPRSCGDRTMPPNTTLDSWYEAFVLMLPLFGFTACAYFFKKHLHIGLSKIHCFRRLWFAQMQLSEQTLLFFSEVYSDNCENVFCFLFLEQLLEFHFRCPYFGRMAVSKLLLFFFLLVINHL